MRIGFVRPDNLSVIGFPPETACMAESLGFCQIGLAPPEFLGRELVLRHVYSAANVLFQAVFFGGRNADASNVPDLAIGPQKSLGGIGSRSFRREFLDEVRHRLAVLWMEPIQVFLNSRRFAGRVEAVHPK